jgi:hypothetical protein
MLVSLTGTTLYTPAWVIRNIGQKHVPHSLHSARLRTTLVFSCCTAPITWFDFGLAPKSRRVAVQMTRVEKEPTFSTGRT